MTAQRVVPDTTGLACVMFSPQHNVLAVAFRNWLVYECFDVPRSLNERLFAAQSKRHSWSGAASLGGITLLAARGTNTTR